MATQQFTTRDRLWKQSSDALNARLCELLPDYDEEDGYLLFARPHINVALVSAVLGAALATQRELLALTQETIAERASMSTGTLRATEKGRRQPTISEFLSLCEALGMDPRVLFTRVLDKMNYPVGYVPVGTSPPSAQPDQSNPSTTCNNPQNDTPQTSVRR